MLKTLFISGNIHSKLANFIIYCVKLQQILIFTQGNIIVMVYCGHIILYTKIYQLDSITEFGNEVTGD